MFQNGKMAPFTGVGSRISRLYVSRGPRHIGLAVLAGTSHRKPR